MDALAHFLHVVADMGELGPEGVELTREAVSAVLAREGIPPQDIMKGAQALLEIADPMRAMFAKMERVFREQKPTTKDAKWVVVTTTHVVGIFDDHRTAQNFGATLKEPNTMFCTATHQ
jgi:hypothetical protein